MSYSSLQANQIDLAGLSGVLQSVLATGLVVRPPELDPFVTEEEQDAFELRVLGVVAAGSGVNYNTGQAILSLNYASGAHLESDIRATGLFLAGIFGGQSSGLSATGSTLTNSVNNLSGSLNTTGALYDPFRLSGIFNATGLLQAKALQNLTGSLLQTGQYLRLQTNNLSGSTNQTGRGLKNDTDALLAGRLTIHGLSGAVLLVGTGTASVSGFGQTLAVYIPPPGEDPAKVISLNEVTGNLFVTGSDDVASYQIGSGTYISGAAGISGSQTGAFATFLHLSETGQNLLARDLLWSGAVALQNAVLHTGLSTLSTLSGALAITGQNAITVSTGVQQIIISGSDTPSVPNWAQNSPDINSLATSFDDDFDSPYLASKWTGINVLTDLDSSGIVNSHFYAYAKAAPTTLVMLVQGCTTGTNWEISSKFNFLPSFTNYNNVGLCVRNATSARVTTFDYEYENSENFSSKNFTNSSFSNQNFESGYLGEYTNVYFRLQATGNSFTFSTSNDNINWRPTRSYVNSWVSSVDQVGLIFCGIGSQMRVAYDWFRATGLS